MTVQEQHPKDIFGKFICDKCLDSPCHFLRIQKEKDKSFIRHIVMNLSCILNPQMREYLNKEVIAELERIKAITDDIPPHLKNENYCRGRTFGIDIAIKLLKEGVRK